MISGRGIPSPHTEVAMPGRVNGAIGLTVTMVTARLQVGCV